MNKCLLCSTKTDGRPAFYADRDWYVGMFENEKIKTIFTESEIAKMDITGFEKEEVTP